MTTSGNVVVFGSADANTMVQARDVASRAERVALMADNHFGYISHGKNPPGGGLGLYGRMLS